MKEANEKKKKKVTHNEYCGGERRPKNGVFLDTGVFSYNGGFCGTLEREEGARERERVRRRE